MRLFIGIPVSQAVREQLEAAWSAVPEKPSNCRSVEPVHWHFTLAFLGEVPEENLEALTELINTAVKQPPHGGFTFTDFRSFPHKRASYVVANALANPSNEWIGYIERLRDMVSVAAPHVDRKPWVPHVTIARAKKNKLLAPWFWSIPSFEWKPTELALIQSEQTASGSIYTQRHVFPLFV